MSIESNLKSIAESLAIIAAAQVTVTVESAPVVETTAAPAPPADTPAPPAPPADTPAPPAPLAAVMTVEELNAGLVIEYKRLGSREKITAIMGAAPYNAVSITNLTPDQFAPLLAAIQAVPA